VRTEVHIRKAEVGETEAQRRAIPWRLLVRVVAVVVFVVVLVFVWWMGSQTSGQGGLHASNAVLSPSSTDASGPQAGACGLACPVPVTTAPAASAPVAAVPVTADPVTSVPVTTGPVAAGSVPVGPMVLPDGSPPPVLIVFDGNAITLSGAVPSAAAGSRLSTLAEAYSKTPKARIVNNLMVDPHTPDTVGVRVIEMNAARFPTGVSAVTGDYALGLSRVVAVMKASPTVSVLVIGHADQRGASDKNLALSQARASAVVEYLVSQGISPDRLSARGLGDHDLLTQQTDSAGLALNRRTEFVFFGLLVGA
jgi:outer membrane protein OmpA-like peptidoglycan-associated protein